MTGRRISIFINGCADSDVPELTEEDIRALADHLMAVVLKHTDSEPPVESLAARNEQMRRDLMELRGEQEKIDTATRLESLAVVAKHQAEKLLAAIEDDDRIVIAQQLKKLTAIRAEYALLLLGK